MFELNEAALHDLLSGRRKDFGAMLLRSGLRLAESCYAMAARGRNFGYDHHWLKHHQVSAPVISVGNITTGGTGKTPVAAWLANWLHSEGRRPGLISRGYRSLSGDPAAGSSGNDEKLVLDRLCPGIPHLQQQDRVSSAQRAIQEFGCDVLLLDDGFQHRRLQRDLDLVLIDALNPFGYEHVLPRGLLREPLNGLKRADLIVITRSDQCPAESRRELIQRIRRNRASDEIVEVAFKPMRLVDVEWNPHPLSELQGKKLHVFCGIGNPAGFRKTIDELGGSFEVVHTLPDHHHYDRSDFARLTESAQAEQAELSLTTQKDLVKIRPTDWKQPPLFALEIGMVFLSGEEILKSRIQQAIAKRA